MLNALQRKLLGRLSLPAIVTRARLTVGAANFVTPKIADAMVEVAEPWLVDLLARLLPQRHGTFLDVGVNLGQTLLAVKAAEPARAYLGVEPNAQCVAYAERLIELNGLAHCQIVPIGLANATALRVLQLYWGATVDSTASLVEGFRPDQKISRVKIVPVFPFPALEQAAGPLTLGIVKIDVEGGEADVLASMRDALQRDRPWIVVEILPCYKPENTERIARQEAIEALLADLGYVRLCLRLMLRPNLWLP